jgi:hypothetical protein
LIPSANITVIPASATVTDTSEVILDSSVTTIDQINAIVPGDLYRREISGTATIPTRKTDTAPADHATGNVVFTNLAGTPATIPLGTIVATTSGVTVRFSTTVEAKLPGDFNARVTVPIRALDPGPIGNVKAFQINFIDGPASAVARVINPAPTGGGSIKPVHVVSFEDKDALRQQLSEQLRKSAIAQMETDLGSDAYVAPASVEVVVLNENFDHLVDDPSDTLTLHVNAVARGMYTSYKDLYKFAESRLLTKFPAGYTVLPGTLKVEADPNARVEGSSVIMRLHSSESGTPQVSTDTILKGLTGKSLDEASQLISQRVKLAEPPRIRVNPSWWPRLPWFGFRLAVFVKPETVSE